MGEEGEGLFGLRRRQMKLWTFRGREIRVHESGGGAVADALRGEGLGLVSPSTRLSCFLSLWNPGVAQPNMGKQECQEFVRKAVAHAMARDGSSGGCIRTVTISADGVERAFLAHPDIPPTYDELPASARLPTTVSAA